MEPLNHQSGGTRMDHEYIDANQIAERYAMGSLSAADAELFEDHYVGCDECLNRLDAVRDMREALRDASSAGSAPPRRAVRWGFWIPSLGFAAAVLCALVLWRDAGRWQNSARAAERGLAEMRERFAKAQLPAALSIPSVSATLVRGAGSGSAAASARLDPVAPFIVLSLEYVPNPLIARYRATITNAAGATLLTIDPVTPNSPDALALAIRSDVLAAGEYTVVLEGTAANGRRSVVGRYAVRLTR